MKIALIKERKIPEDKRVVFTPEICIKAMQMFPQMEIEVEKSEIRCIPNEEYVKAGIKVVDDVANCDVLIGVKEVPIENLIAGKKYFFFSHTIKKQALNRKLLQAILDKKITLFDHETITAQNNVRLIGFGYYAGIVGAYNGFRTWGLKYDEFQLPAVETLKDKLALVSELRKIKLQPIKILLTGTGRVGAGAKEILDTIYIKQVSVEAFINQVFDEPVYCQVDVLDYNKRKDGQQKDIFDFFKHPKEYESDFLRFTYVADMLIAGHFHNQEAPDFFSLEDIRHPDFNIRVIADISCDIGHPMPTTLRASTITNPFYGFDRNTGVEGDYFNLENIAIMAVDNLPACLPKDASDGFGEMFLEHVIPAFFNGDKNGILERAKITEKGKLTDRYSYLQDFVDVKE